MKEERKKDDEQGAGLWGFASPVFEYGVGAEFEACFPKTRPKICREAKNKERPSSIL